MLIRRIKTSNMSMQCSKQPTHLDHTYTYTYTCRCTYKAEFDDLASDGDGVQCFGVLYLAFGVAVAAGGRGQDAVDCA